MSTRASIILWSTGSGVLLGIFIDALILGIWAAATTFLPPRPWPRWASAGALTLLLVIPLAAGLLGYLEGRLKLE